MTTLEKQLNPILLGWEVVTEDSLANAGYVITGSGGGGADGGYVFASVAELDGVIEEWAELRDRIDGRQRDLARAVELTEPPAGDVMSQLHARVLHFSLRKALAHNRAMLSYAKGYLSKLYASREQYLVTEAEYSARFRALGGS